VQLGVEGGWVTPHVLRVADRVVAWEMVEAHADRARTVACGADPDLAAARPGPLLRWHVVASLAHRGVRALELPEGDADGPWRIEPRPQHALLVFACAWPACVAPAA
ncbi:MAG: GNAT family N-acetyltransferase, partial [Myxococcales bacterium]